MWKKLLRLLRLKKVVVATGGGFDPLHEGHIRLFREAKKLGDELVIMLNSDMQVSKKKGATFYPSQEERKEILESIKYIDRVIIDPGKDTTCEDGLRAVKPDILAKGGDRVEGAMPEVELKACRELGIKIVYNVGGEKVQSSSWLLKRAKQSAAKK
ncbi:MAG: adenylyltransferase/cytidyltransferase family protein [Dehalococcoidales bacterium]|nr:adenylyltransferase/cytidyltransferase family protein [Dehalococcoidales bacterium]